MPYDRTFFVTTVTWQRTPLFRNPQKAELMMDVAGWPTFITRLPHPSRFSKGGIPFSPVAVRTRKGLEIGCKIKSPGSHPGLDIASRCAAYQLDCSKARFSNFVEAEANAIALKSFFQ